MNTKKTSYFSVLALLMTGAVLGALLLRVVILEANASAYHSPWNFLAYHFIA